MTENVGPNDIIGKTSSSQTKRFCMVGYGRKSIVFPTNFQLFEQKIINPENTQLVKFHDLPILDACLARDENWLLLEGYPTLRLVTFFLRQHMLVRNRN